MKLCSFPILGGSPPDTKTESSLLSFFWLTCLPSCLQAPQQSPNWLFCALSVYLPSLTILHCFLLPVNGSCCSTQVCPQNSQIGTCFCPCLSSNLNFHSRLNILLLHVLQEVSFLALIYSVFPFWVLYFFLWNQTGFWDFCLLKRMKWNYHAQRTGEPGCASSACPLARSINYCDTPASLQ